MEAVPAAAASGLGEAAFSRFLRGRDEPAWLIERRRRAFARFHSFPFPSPGGEEWRRTDLRGLRLDTFSPPGLEPRPAGAAAAELDGLGLARRSGASMEHRDGGLAHEPERIVSSGAVLMDLNRALKDQPELIEQYLLTTAVRPDDDYFAALHAAYWSSGLLLHVPRSVCVDAPFHSLIGLSPGATDFHHTLVVLEPGAQATLIRETVSTDLGDAPSLHAGALEIFLGSGARLQLIDVQSWNHSTWHFSRERAMLSRDASLDWTVAALGGRLARVNQEVVLGEPGAAARVNGVLFSSGRQHLAYATRQLHCAPHTTSDLLYKGGLKDHSRIVWKGMIRVEKDAQRTDAYQRNDNLVLSDKARADSIPGLEIEANDVRCTHGATAGRVDPDMIFYLQARGIPQHQAVRLVVEGFFTDVLDRIPLEMAREALGGAVARKL